VKHYSILACVALIGCVAAPTRQTEPGSFKLEASGQVRPDAAQAATDCIMDGLDGASLVMTNITVRQQRRVGGYRVESISGPNLYASADIRDTGIIELRLASPAAINLDKEKAAVAACIEKHR
jgi:hypothetical protein